MLHSPSRRRSSARSPQIPPRHTAAASERGSALIAALLMLVVIMGLVLTNSQTLDSHRDLNDTRFARDSQALALANSGLTDGLGWLRKQTSQPVTALDPQRDELATPPVLETEEPDIGIVREFQISGTTWGRYEVWKEWAADPDPDRLAFRTQMQCRDVSAARGGLTAGTVWRLRSVGYVYERRDAAVAFDAPPNRVIAQDIAEMEARRLAMNLPGQAAVCVRTASGVLVSTRGQIRGGSAAAGLFSESGTGSPTVTGTAAEISGSPGTATNTPYEDSLDAVFGATADELRAMADIHITDPSAFPSPLPTNSLVVCSGDLSFTDTQRLLGSGIVIVLGDLAIEAGSYSSFSGLIYVGGNFTMQEPAEIRGSVVVTGSATVSGGTGDFARVLYDDEILAALRRELGSYRQSSTVLRPLDETR